MHAGVEVTLPDGSKSICKAMLLFAVCDLPAKAALMNCNQFNGKHGCATCTIESEQVLIIIDCMHGIKKLPNIGQVRSWSNPSVHSNWEQ